MASTEDQSGAKAPTGEVAPSNHVGPNTTEAGSPGASVSYSPTVDNSYASAGDGYPYEDSTSSTVVPPDVRPTEVLPAAAPVETSTAIAPSVPVRSGGGSTAPPPQPPSGSGGDDEEDGMLRMSFLEHLEELRTRLFRMLIGIGVAFVASLTFSNELWNIVSAPAVDALKNLKINPPNLTIITPMEGFNIIWVKLPILCAIFLASPWVLYQVWAFIAPGLYKKERRWAAPFVICSSGLFITGGLFAYFVAFRFGLTFLLGIGRGAYITPMVSVSEYFDLFVNVILGVAIVFELPVLIFFLTLLHILSPRFLMNHSRYAILGIVVLAAVVTPTPDVFNMMLFATPMCLLFYVGVFASYLLVLNRENRRFPWGKALMVVFAILAVIAGIIWFAITRYGYRLVPHWPFLIR